MRFLGERLGRFRRSLRWGVIGRSTRASITVDMNEELVQEIPAKIRGSQKEYSDTSCTYALSLTNHGQLDW